MNWISQIQTHGIHYGVNCTDVFLSVHSGIFACSMDTKMKYTVLEFEESKPKRKLSHIWYRAVYCQTRKISHLNQLLSSTLFKNCVDAHKRDVIQRHRWLRNDSFTHFVWATKISFWFVEFSHSSAATKTTSSTPSNFSLTQLFQGHFSSPH